MKPNIFGFIGPGFLHQVPTLGLLPRGFAGGEPCLGMFGEGYRRAVEGFEHLGNFVDGV